MRFGWLAAVVGAGALIAGCDPEPFTMVVTVNDVALIAYRDGDGEWKPVEEGLTGRARIRIETGRYSLAWACGTGRTSWFVIHSTLGDEPQADCSFIENPIRVSVSGTASPFASIYIGTRGSKVEEANGEPITTADSFGFYSAFIPAGYYDVVAVARGEGNAPVRALIQHDTDLRSSRTLDLPVDALGAEFTVVQPTITGSLQDVTLWAELHTRNGTHARFAADGETLHVVPASQLVDGDSTSARVEGSLGCNTSARIDGPAIDIEVPDPPVPLIERQRFRWSPEGDWRYVQLTLGGDGSTTITATRDWMEAQGTDGVEIPDFSTLPGFGPDLLNLQPVSWTFVAERGHPSSVFDTCQTNGSIMSL